MAKKFEKKHVPYTIDDSKVRRDYRSYKYEYIGRMLMGFSIILAISIALILFLLLKMDMELINIFFIIPLNAMFFIGFILYIAGRFFLRSKGFPYD